MTELTYQNLSYMELINFACVGGSRAYGLQLPYSDIDLLILSKDKRGHTNRDGYNLCYFTAENFISWMTSNKGYLHSYQILFPSQWMTNDKISAYLRENREEIVDANLQGMYNTLMSYFLIVKENADVYYKIASKRVAYGLLYANAIYDHSCGKSFAECVCPQGQLHDILLGIRNKEFDFDYVSSLLDECKIKAESVKLYYDKPILEKPLHEFSNLIRSYNYMTYEEMREAGLLMEYKK